MNGKAIKKRINKIASVILTLALVLMGAGTFAGLSGILAPAIKVKAEGTELNHAVTAGTEYEIGGHYYTATATADSGDVTFIAIYPTSQTYSFNDLSEVFEADGSALDVDDASDVVADLDKAGLIPALSMSTWQYDTTSGIVSKQGYFGVPSKEDVEAAGAGFRVYSAAWTSTKADSDTAYYFDSSFMTDSADTSKGALVAFKLNLSAEGVHTYVLNGADRITHAVPIDEEHFPDANFRNYVPCGSDGILTVEEAAGMTVMYVNSKEIADLTGVEYFTALTYLDCSGNNLTSLDVSHNTALKNLYCQGNNLTSLDVSNNTALTGLYCDSNQLTSLDVSHNTALTGLNCSINPLTSLDLSNNTALTRFVCSNNQLTSLDLSNNTALTSLDCSKNPLTDLKYSLAASNGGTVEITNGGYGTFTPTWESSNISGKLTLATDNYGVTDTHVFTNWAAEGTGVDLSMSSDGRTATVTFNNSESWTDKAVKISGTWGERVYVLTVKEVYQNENGEAERTETATENHSYNDSVTKTATVPDGYSIVGESSATVTMDDNKTITFTYRKNAPEGITINETTFPDANFRNYVLSQTYGSDGILTAEEIAEVTAINVNEKEIADLTGIEHFTALKYLYCYNNSLTSLDVSNNPALTYLLCSDNSLTALKVKFGSSGSLATISNGGFGTIDVSYPFVEYKKIGFRDPTADGYTFTGWEITGDVTKEEGPEGSTDTFFTFGTGDATITATWKQNFTVTYADGQGNTLQSTTVTEGSATPECSGTPERSGYTFAGWTPTVADTVTADVTYTATWKQLFTVKYMDGQGATLLEETVAEGSATPTYSGTPAREGYTFAGWTPEVAPTVTADATYTATWTQNAPTTHTITIESRFLDKDSQLLNTTTRTATYEEGETVTIEAPAVDGYFIVGQDSVSLTVDNDSTVVFVYQQDPDPTAPSDPLDYDLTLSSSLKMRWQGISGETITRRVGNITITYGSKKLGRFAGKAIITVDPTKLPDGKSIKVSIPTKNITLAIGGVEVAATVEFEDTVFDNTSGSRQLIVTVITDRSDLPYDDFFGKPISGSIAVSVEELT